MSRPCSICQHPDRTALPQDLEAREPLWTSAARWAVSQTALRHRDDHLRPQGHVDRDAPPRSPYSQPSLGRGQCPYGTGAG